MKYALKAPARVVNTSGVACDFPYGLLLPFLRGVCVKVEDGDTIVVLDGERPQPVRLAGVDGAEFGDGPRSACVLASIQRQRLAAEVMGSNVVVCLDPLQRAVDRFGRIVGYVWRVSDRVDVNRFLIEWGVCRAWREGRYLRREEFHALEDAARARGKCLWQDLPRRQDAAGW